MAVAILFHIPWLFCKGRDILSCFVQIHLTPWQWQLGPPLISDPPRFLPPASVLLSLPATAAVMGTSQLDRADVPIAWFQLIYLLSVLRVEDVDGTGPDRLARSLAF